MVISITTLLMCDSVAMSSGVPHHEWSIGTESRPRSYEITNGWGGRHPVNGAPVFVLTHNPPTEYPKGPSRLTFVTDGIASAIRQPQEVAGGKNIKLGGASPGKQALAAGLCDEIVVHLAPYLLGGGVRLFDEMKKGTRLDKLAVKDGPNATHLHYRVAKT
jgi:dihydrofolate reductase